MSDLVKTITELSHEFGTTKYVRAGGGNTSCKTADVLWVKPSGTTLAGLQPETFVQMDRPRLGRLYSAQPPAEAAAREELVKNMMADAVLPATAGKRASVEAALHDSLAATFVVHTHPAWVNGLTCALNGAVFGKAFFPDALWLPYIDPGYTLCMAVRKAIVAYRTAHGGKEPQVIFLENHGIFVAADTAEEIRAIYGAVEAKLSAAYAAAGIDAQRVAVAPLTVDEATLNGWKAVLAEGLGADGAAVVCSGRFDVAAGPISPDHMVYAKSYAYEGILTVENLKAITAARGYAPRVIVLPEAVLGVGKNEKAAALALELAMDGALVKQTARAFGGIRYMDDRARLFIENCEVEAYRAKQQA